jgi:hypothetical protein
MYGHGFGLARHSSKAHRRRSSGGKAKPKRKPAAHKVPTIGAYSFGGAAVAGGKPKRRKSAGKKRVTKKRR